ncbi:MAG: M20/M25/M40 family metallo-hydrolase, partial [Bryobacterales bacterium]|nr:M20/M25/M40 family metallo-hydrolase [Bryobacterales bacterium]
PGGCEQQAQQYVAGFLRGLGLTPAVYALEDVDGLREHPLYWPHRHYMGRPNVSARVKGTGGGRSLILSGHIDTVPRGSLEWHRDPFGGEIEDGRMYGRGACDMKSGIAIGLTVLERLRDQSVRLRGDLIFESIVDEEFGGVNGTLAGRVRGDLADAAIVTEPSGLRICPAQRGGRLLHLLFSKPADIFVKDHSARTAIGSVTNFLARLPELAALRKRSAPRHEHYRHTPDPVPVSVTNLSTNVWGWSEPVTVPSGCKVELFLQAMPGETEDDVMGQLREWLAAIGESPEVTCPIRWLPGSAIAADHPLVTTLAGCGAAELGAPPLVQGIEAPCDMYVFHEFGVPAVLWGATGANMHAPDEWVDLASLDAAAAVLERFVKEWCGVASGKEAE